MIDFPRQLRAMAGCLFLVLSAAGAAQAEKSEAASAALPEAIRTSGKLNVATNFSYPPFMFLDDKNELTGLDVDIMREVAKKLGVEPVFHDLKLSAMLTSVGTGRNDVAIGQMAVTKERLERFDYTPYFKVAMTAVVPIESAGFDINSLCGRLMSTVAGSAQLVLMDEMSQKCESDGKQPIRYMEVPDEPLALMNVESGRAEAYLNTPPSAAWNVKDSPKLKVADDVITGYVHYNGYMYRLGNEELGKAFAIALGEMIDDGTYQRVLEKYGASANAVDKAVVTTPAAELVK